MSKIDTKARRRKLHELCSSWKISLKEFAPNSFRLSVDDKIIDYYPKSNKCFWHSDHDWGEVTDLKAFLKFEFYDHT